MLNVKTLLCAIAVMILSVNASAQLIADKTAISSATGLATVSVSFPKPVQGDLYLATPLNGRLYFFADNGTTLTTEIKAFIKEADFSSERVVLKLASEGVPPGVYTLFQVVTAAGADPLDSNNWLDGLSALEFRINLPVADNFSPALPVVTPTPTLILTPPVLTCSASKASVLQEAKDDKDDDKDDNEHATCEITSGSVSPQNLVGSDLYVTNCAGCHGNSPKANRDHVLRGTDYKITREAIYKNKGNMGIFLNGISDAELQAIAIYLRTF